MKREITQSKREPRKHPRQDRSQVTVTAILDATGIVLAKFGLRGFSTNRVARLAGVSIGSLYQYFPSKESMFLAFVERQRESDLLLVGAAVAQARDLPFAEGVRVVVRQVMSLYKARAAYSRVLFQEFMHLRIDNQIRAQKQMEETVVLWLRTLSGSEADGRLDSAAFVVVRAVLATLVAHFLEAPAANRTDAIIEDHLVDLIVGFLTPYATRATGQR